MTMHMKFQAICSKVMLSVISCNFQKVGCLFDDDEEHRERERVRLILFPPYLRMTHRVSRQNAKGVQIIQPI